MDDAARLAADLVAIDSVNPALVAGGAGEAAIAAHVARWLGERGLEVEVVEPVPGRPSVVGIARGSGGGRSLMLNAHLDTVGVEGMADPFTPRVAGGRLHGRGAYDMKGALAACMVAGARAAGAGLRGDVLVTAVADEEHASLGARAVAERFAADGAVVTEPTGLRCCVAHKGFAWLDVEVRGRAAHGSRPDLGVDAIARAGRVLVGVEELDAALGARRHPLLGRGSIHASLIAGGQERSSYPARCVVSLERRTLPGETPEQVETEVRELCAGVDAGVTLGLVRDPFEVDAGAPIVTTLREAAGGVLGAPPDVVGDTPWMDAAILAAAGIPTVVFGPAGAGAHAAEEWVDLASVARCADVLEATATGWCA